MYVILYYNIISVVQLKLGGDDEVLGHTVGVITLWKLMGDSHMSVDGWKQSNPHVPDPRSSWFSETGCVIIRHHGTRASLHT